MSKKDLYIRSSSAEFLIFEQQKKEQGIEVRFEDGDLWLTQKALGELYNTSKQDISYHLSNIFKEIELEQNSVVKNYLTTASDGKKYKTNYYNLDAVISVGYRVNTDRAIQFRRWATNVLKEFSKKGYIIDKNHEIKENGARGLEELFNELETDERTNGATAPNFAHRLDRITDRNLHFARRNHSLTDYYISMQNIIPSRDKAMLLLMGIEAYYNCVGQQNKEFASKLEEKISQILDDYEIKKISSRNDVAHQSITSESTELNISDDTDSR